MKDEGDPTRSKRRLWIAVLVIGGSAIATLLLIVNTDRNLRFDAEVWQSETSPFKGLDLRRRMIDDLRHNVLTHGMSRTEIELILGQDDSLLLRDAFDMVYSLGQGPGVGTTTRFGGSVQFDGPTEWLVLKFNAHDQLVEWRVVTR